MTSRLRKKPPTTVQTFLGKATSSAALVAWLLSCSTSAGQFQTHPIETQPKVDAGSELRPTWGANRPQGVPRDSAAARSHATQAPRSAANRTRGWTEPRSLKNTTAHLEWRRPHLRSDERPRRIPGPIRAATTRATPKQPAKPDSVESSVRLVQHASNQPIPRLLHPGVTQPVAQQEGTGLPDFGDIFPEEDEGDLRSRFQDQTPTEDEPLSNGEPATVPDEVPNNSGDDATSSRFDVDGSFFDDTPGDTDVADGQDPLESLPAPPETPSVIEGFDEALSEYSAASDEAAPGELAEFNNQDCDATAESCRTNAQYVTYRERKDIAIDITPSFAPREEDAAEVESARQRKLADAPSRAWHNRDGRVLANGRLEDYSDGYVFIRGENNVTSSFRPDEISDEDWCFVAAWWDIPTECRFDNEPYRMRDFRLTTFTWTAPGTCHKPLYFEEVAVERYGHTSGPIIQPVVSGAHFFGNILMLPYHMGLNPPNECLYTLGYYRPGDCAPWLVPGFPMSTRGVKWQGLALGAAIALLP